MAHVSAHNLLSISLFNVVHCCGLPLQQHYFSIFVYILVKQGHPATFRTVPESVKKNVSRCHGNFKRRHISHVKTVNTHSRVKAQLKPVV